MVPPNLAMALRLLVLGLLVITPSCLSECIQSSDELCAMLNREGCDPLGTEDVCGPCVYGTIERDDGLSPQPPCALITCPMINDPNAIPDNTDAQVPIGTTVQYQCKEGFKTAEQGEGAYLRTCGDSGVLDGTDSCEPLKCEVTNDAINATADSLDPVPVGSTVTYSCLPGYIAINKASKTFSFTRTCLPSATLSPPLACSLFDACTAKTVCAGNTVCLDLSPPSNDYVCRCRDGLMGKPRKGPVDCYTVAVRTRNNTLAITALDLQLDDPLAGERVSLWDIVAEIADVSTAIARANTASAEADRALGVRIDDANKRVDAATAAVNTESSRARTAEAAIQAAVTSEATRALAAEKAIQDTITTLTADLQQGRTDLNTEVSRAVAAEASINTAVSNGVTAAVGNTNAEITRATSTEASIQATVVAFSTTVSTLRVDLTAEITRATSTEAVLSAAASTAGINHAASSTGVSSLTVSHSTTRSTITAADAATTSEKTRAISAENSINTQVTGVRSDLTVAQGTLTTVSTTVASQTVTISSLTLSIASIMTQINGLATSMTNAQAAIATASTTVASQTTAASNTNTNFNTQSTRVNTLSTQVGTLQTATNTLSTNVASLSTTVGSVTTTMNAINTKVNVMTTTACDPNSGQFVYGYSASGSILCSTYSYSYLRTWYHNKCWTGMGWIDGCNGCGNAPSKFATVWGNGNCRSNNGGANNFCGSGWAGINTDGTVNDDDNFHTRISCDP